MTAPETAVGVADTAFLTAAFRMQESARADALFRDPLAARLAGDKGRALLDGVAHLGPIAGWSTVVRTTLIDGFLARAVDAGVTCVLNLGAGLDTRPYRLEVPAALQWVEVDLPAIIALKDERLAGEEARCALSRVPLDLTDVDARRALFSRVAPKGARVLVLTEGVAPYLSEDEVAALAEDLRGSAGVEGWIIDSLPAELIRARQAMGASTRLHEIPMRFAPADWAGFFAAHGWRVSELKSLADEGSARGRPFPAPEAMRVTTTGGGGARPFAAYGWLVPDERTPT